MSDEKMVTIPLKDLRKYKSAVLELRDLFEKAKQQESRLTPGNVSHRGFLSNFLACGIAKAKETYDELQKLCNEAKQRQDV